MNFVLASMVFFFGIDISDTSTDYRYFPVQISDDEVFGRKAIKTPASIKLNVPTGDIDSKYADERDLVNKIMDAVVRGDKDAYRAHLCDPKDFSEGVPYAWPLVTEALSGKKYALLSCMNFCGERHYIFGSDNKRVLMLPVRRAEDGSLCCPIQDTLASKDVKEVYNLLKEYRVGGEAQPTPYRCDVLMSLPLSETATDVELQLPVLLSRNSVLPVTQAALTLLGSLSSMLQRLSRKEIEPTQFLSDVQSIISPSGIECSLEPFLEVENSIYGKNPVDGLFRNCEAQIKSINSALERGEIMVIDADPVKYVIVLSESIPQKCINVFYETEEKGWRISVESMWPVDIMALAFLETPKGNILFGFQSGPLWRLLESPHFAAHCKALCENYARTSSSAGGES